MKTKFRKISCYFCFSCTRIWLNTTLFCYFLGLSWPRKLLHPQPDLKTIRSTSLGIRAPNVLAKTGFVFYIFLIYEHLTLPWTLCSSNGTSKGSFRSALHILLALLVFELSFACARTPRQCSCFNQNNMKFDSRRGTRTTLQNMTKPLLTSSI